MMKIETNIDYSKQFVDNLSCRSNNSESIESIVLMLLNYETIYQYKLEYLKIGNIQFLKRLLQMW
ncbi:MAG: hypothetical protein MUP85_03740 [Candidatus Lokiarchaeota archaeon]|nr:hypothetical protein [Candidatus Lokiarchaeota archaeon]